MDTAIIDALEGILPPPEGEKLASLAWQAPHLPILEIGSYKGKSTCYLASGAHNVVYALDMWDLRYQDYAPSRTEQKRGFGNKSTFETFQEQVNSAGLQNRIVTVKGDSSQVGKIWSIPLGMLFIDGNHTYDMVKSDYVMFARHVVSGGYLAMHDYVIPDVRRVIEIAQRSGEWVDFKITNGNLFTARKK